MIESLYLPIISAFYLGLITSISPCPLATNIAATSFLSQHIQRTSLIFRTGIFYALGRIISYIMVAAIIIFLSIKVNIVAMFLQRNINKMLGPILIIVGLVLLNLISLNFSFKLPLPKKLDKLHPNVANSFLLGFLFALSFCPISAALFFGSLIPLALKSQYSIVLAVVYGFATGLPVIIFALLLSYSAKSIASYFNIINKIEVYLRKLTGIIFVLGGIYYSIIYIFKITI